MTSTNQNIFIVFALGLFLTTLSMLLLKTHYFLYLFLFGIWTMLFSAFLWRYYGTRLRTKMSVSNKEQLLSDFQRLIK